MLLILQQQSLENNLSSVDILIPRKNLIRNLIKKEVIVVKKRLLTLICSLTMAGILLTGCGGSGKTEEKDAASQPVQAEAALEDGVYLADFNTDSSMFHVNESCDGKGTLTVADGQMTIHISLVSKNVVNLYAGLAEDAQKDGAEILEATLDEVTYDDGMTEEVFGFDVPVPALDEEFDLALVGKKGTWYDHKVSVSNPELLED